MLYGLRIDRKRLAMGHKPDDHEEIPNWRSKTANLKTAAKRTNA